jgi:uncharacterized protein YraI
VRLIKQIILLSVILILTATTFAQDTNETTTVIAQAFRTINIRSGPSTDYNIIGHLNEGDIAQVIGRGDVDGNWLLIQVGEQQGWVAYFTVTLNGDPQLLPIIATEIIRSPSLNSTVSFAPASAGNGLYVTAYRRVNIRSGPGTEFQVIGILPPGNTADVIGTSGANHEWLQIRHGEVTGWVAYFVVTISGDINVLSSLPETNSTVIQANAETAALPVDRNQVILITRFNTNLRAEPNLTSAIIDVVPYQTTIEADQRTQNGNWLRVNHNNQIGWIIASLVNAGVSNVQSLPVVQP